MGIGHFTAAAPRPEGSKALQPQYLPAFVPMDQIDRSAGQWRKELELGELGLTLMGLSINDVVRVSHLTAHLDGRVFWGRNRRAHQDGRLSVTKYCKQIDCSRSMHTELERLKRDVCVMTAALALVAKEPRIGITLFTTGGVTDTLPLTDNPAALVAHIGKARSAGKGTEEEWAGGLEEALRRSNWGPAEAWNRRVIVILSDEPMLNWQFEKALPFVKQAAAAQFRIYSVPIRKEQIIDDPLSAPLDRTGSSAAGGGKHGGKGGGGANQKNDRSWNHYQTLADETGGAVIGVAVPRTELGLGYLVAPAKGDELAPLCEGGGPGSRVLMRVLTDAINPKYSDRIEPIVKVLVAYCQGSAPSLREDRTTIHKAWDAKAAQQ